MFSPLEKLKTLLESHGLRPQKRFGQNFMVDPNFALSVARAAKADSRTLVVEIGPGTGLLTHAILSTHPHARMLALEIDRNLVRILQHEFKAELDSGRLTLLCGDVLSGKHALNAELLRSIVQIVRNEDRARLILCANLPYNAATSLLINLLLCTAPELQFERLIGTVQLEMALRILGRLGTADYGPLAIYAALRAHAKITRKVGPEVFWPRPKVDSAVVELELIPWSNSELKPEEALCFQEFIGQIFRQRRKMLRRVCGKRYTIAQEIMESVGTQRAEEISPIELLQLFRALTATQNKPANKT